MANVGKVSEWHTHKMGCAKCQEVDSRSTASLALCCIIGAPLLRDYLVQAMAPDVRAKRAANKREFIGHQEGESHRTTKQKLKEVTRYK